MTEEEWLNGTDINQLLSLVWQRRKASWRQRLPNSIPHRSCQRKLRLFICGCWRLTEGGEPRPLERDAVAMAEAFADGLGSAYQLAEVGAELPPGLARLATSRQALLRDAAAQAASGLIDHRARHRLGLPLGVEPYKCERDKWVVWKAARAQESRFFCDLLRDLLGNPFRLPPTLCPDWLAWQGGTVTALARAIYEEHAFSQLPVLADALEEAGCTAQAILDHLRGPGPHVRGCWAVNLFLGKE